MPEQRHRREEARHTRVCLQGSEDVSSGCFRHYVVVDAPSARTMIRNLARPDATGTLPSAAQRNFQVNGASPWFLSLMSTQDLTTTAHPAYPCVTSMNRMYRICNRGIYPRYYFPVVSAPSGMASVFCSSIGAIHSLSPRGIIFLFLKLKSKGRSQRNAFHPEYPAYPYLT